MVHDSESSKVRGRFGVFDSTLDVGDSAIDRVALADKVAFELEMQFVQP